jgi:alginate O-acetyltransferase complex protein AlgI
MGIAFLVGASSIFYAWHHPTYIFLIFSSIFVNFYSAKLMSRQTSLRKVVFIITVSFNIFLIFLFKYYNFFISNINVISGVQFSLLNTLLPLGISFFTFQQIGFIVSIYRKTEEMPNFLEYSAFITFFPQLIAGPIVKHSDYLPQLKTPLAYRISAKNIAIGGTIFVIGLYKKVILADSVGAVADTAFSFVSSGKTLNFTEAWLGAISYSFQIYFDFSGYSDMAIGLSRMFNIKLPCNFLSPYRATSIIDFWRRWHISLSSFLRESIYIPLGGNRKGNFIRFSNLMITMLIGGLWHGASWAFVVWGGIHGVLLIVNHLLRHFLPKPEVSGRGIRFVKTLSVFTVVTFAWVFFRAESFADAQSVLGSMLNFRSLAFPHQIVSLFTKFGVDLTFLQKGFLLNPNLLKQALVFCSTCAVIAFCFPNVYDWLAYFKPAKDYQRPFYVRENWFKKIAWRPTIAAGLFILLLLTFAFGEVNSRNEFIYFQF